ncbi:MAG: 3-dehydroquinate dehydratase [Clostridiaceae bacterium BRH_c20a]|nr:MAG: 3-dehydroquinate dehydratase [Clostridiaceae bacterium BRH_c20a]
MKILVIDGPNINMLGIRRPETYGTTSMETIHERLRVLANELGCQINFFQSNHEGQIVDQIQKSYEVYNYLLINAAAYTHTSIAIRDAIEAVSIPTIEVHLSNIHAREPFRHISMLASVCRGQICGFGYLGYEMALRVAVSELKESNL